MVKQAFRPLLVVAGLLAAVVLYVALGGSVQGRLVDAETGQSLAGVAVTVAGQATQTDGEGNFQVRGLRGLPVVQASAPGFKPVRGALVVSNLFGRERLVTLRMEPSELRGAVSDAATRKPLAGATVRVGQQQTRTDGEGHYVVKRVLPGEQIVVSARYYSDSAPVPYDGQATQEIALTLAPITVIVRNLYTDEPLPGATVVAAGQTAQADAQGQVTFAKLPLGTEVFASLAGYAQGRIKADPGDKAVLGLRPSTLRGTVHDQNGQPLANALVLVRAAGREPKLTYTNGAGEYELTDVPENATLVVRMAGYKRLERQLGRETGLSFELEPFVVKGIYLSSGVLMPGAEALLKQDLDLVDKTELNAVVIEVKADDGYLAFAPKLQLARDIGARNDSITSLASVLADCKRRNIYTIARVVIFKDSVLGRARPEWAVRRNNGGVWKDSIGTIWMDPFRKEVWDYNLALCKEIVDLGFDEIQLDYIRFPSDGDIMDTNYIMECTRANRVKAIADFVAYVRKELDKMGAFFSVDMFGLTTSIDLSLRFGDLGIGQQLADVAPFADYISPMVYPSTYEPGNLGLRDPGNSPYEVVKISVADGRERAGKTLIRPWLQYNNAGGTDWGPREFRLEKQAAVESGAYGWLFWNIWGQYDVESFDPQ